MTNNKGFNGQFSFFPSIAAQYGIPAKIQTSFDNVPSTSSETSADSLSSPVWNTPSNTQLPIQSFLDYDGSNLNDDSDSSSTCSNLLKFSKKIHKLTQESVKPVPASNRRPNRRRNPWSAQEDAKLLELMQKHGQCWAIISSSLPGRTGKQVRDRYVNNLAPGIECGNWTPEEDDLIERLRNEKGNRWSYIASYLPGRSEAQVKNRYYSFILKKKNEMTVGTNQACYFSKGSEASNSPIASSEMELCNESAMPETEYNFGISAADNITPVCPITNSDVMGSNQVTVISDEERITYGNIIRIPCLPAKSERFANPLTLLSNQASDKSDSSQYNQQTESSFQFVIEDENQVDDFLEHMVDYMDCKEPDDVGIFLADDLVKEESNQEFKPSQREIDLKKRRDYLEMMLAETIKEMQGL